MDRFLDMVVPRRDLLKLLATPFGHDAIVDKDKEGTSDDPFIHFGAVFYSGDTLRRVFALAARELGLTWVALRAYPLDGAKLLWGSRYALRPDRMLWSVRYFWRWTQTERLPPNRAIDPWIGERTSQSVQHILRVNRAVLQLKAHDLAWWLATGQVEQPDQKVQHHNDGRFSSAG